MVLRNKFGSPNPNLLYLHRTLYLYVLLLPMKKFHFYPILLFAACCTNAQDFSTKNLKKHITTLADDSFKGRGTGTDGEKAAADYIISTFKTLKLKPNGTDGIYLQSFPFKKGIHGEGESGTASNVIGYLDNQASTTVIIGAHYDHLGT